MPPPETSAEKISALFLFNHKFEPNVAKLEALYGDRFANRKYVMPFGRETDKVIPVYETSYRFSGHLAQARDRILEDDVTHYVVISDDLILNPALNEGNIVSSLGLGPDSGYIKALGTIDDLRYRWWRALMIVNDFERTENYFDYKAELPPADQARARFEAMGLRFPKPVPRSREEWRFALRRLPKELKRTDWGTIYTKHGKPAPYPLLCGYADFFVVPGKAMKTFLYYCGVFAALNVFAEAAVPTALALAVDDLRTELKPGELFDDPHAARNPEARFTGVEYWTGEETEAFAARYGNDMKRLTAEFPPDWLYVHPVKLSRWR
jgi:hypothetical protein